MDQLAQELAQLKAEAEQLRLQGNDSAYIAKLREIDEKQKQYDDAKANVSMPPMDGNDDAYTITAGGQTINLRDYVTDETFYQVLKIALSQRDYEIESQHQAEIESLTRLKDEQIQQYKSQIEAIQAAANAKYADLETQYKDVSSKLTAATDQIDSLNVRIKELEATQDKPKFATNMDSTALAEAIRKANEAKPAIYGYVEVDGRTATAKLLETDEEITFNPIYKGKYRIVSDEEAARFREERDAAKAAAVESVPEADSVSDEPGVAIPPATFQSDDETSVPGSQDASVQPVHDEGATGGTESLEARVKALEDRVSKLEGGSAVAA